jgi:hypothetical protein
MNEKLIYYDQINIKYSDALAVILLALVTFLLAGVSYIFSNYDEFSFCSSLVLFISGIAITRTAKKYGLIFSFSTWINYLILYIIVSYVVFMWLWFIPLRELGDLRTAMQMPEYQDANYYDYLAELAAKLPFTEWPAIINATWLSQGVISYLAFIYKYFGISQFNYLFINIILGYLSVIFLQGIISSNGRDFGMLALFMPYTLYYNITPGKEVLTNVVVFSILYFYFKIRNSMNSHIFTNSILIIMPLFLLALIRFNALIMVLVVVASYSLFHAKNRFKLILKFGLAGSIALALFYAFGLLDLFYQITDIDSHASQMVLRLQNSEPGSIKFVLATMLTSDNFFINTLLAPIRVFIWMLAPFPFLNILDLTQSILFDNSYTTFRSGEALARSISSLVMVYFLYKFSIFARSSKIIIDNSSNYILFSALTFSLILSTTNFIEGARYRTIIEPLIACWLLFILDRFKSDAHVKISN